MDHKKEFARDVLQYRPGAERTTADAHLELSEPETSNVESYSERHIPWLHIGVFLIVLAAIVIPVGWRWLAAEPVLPFLQAGSARDAYVGGVYKGCMRKQRAAPENASLTTPELGEYCLCFGRALADVIN